MSQRWALDLVVAGLGQTLASSGAFSCTPQLGIAGTCSVIRLGDCPDFTVGYSCRICSVFGQDHGWAPCLGKAIGCVQKSGIIRVGSSAR